MERQLRCSALLAGTLLIWPLAASGQSTLDDLSDDEVAHLLDLLDAAEAAEAADQWGDAADRYGEMLEILPGEPHYVLARAIAWAHAGEEERARELFARLATMDEADVASVAEQWLTRLGEADPQPADDPEVEGEETSTAETHEVTLRVSPDEATVFIPGAEARVDGAMWTFELAPEPVDAMISAPGYATSVVTIAPDATVVGVDLISLEEAPAGPTMTGPVVLGAVGVSLLGLGSYWGWNAMSTADRLNEHPSDYTLEGYTDERDLAASEANRANVAFATGGLLVAGGLYWWQHNRKRIAVTPSVSQHHVGLRASIPW